MMNKLLTRLKTLLQTRASLASTPLASNTGFSLVEMLVVITLIALVGTFVVSNIMGKLDQAKVDSTKIQINQLGTVLDQFKLDCGFYPETDQGLDALIQKPEVGRECKNYDPEGYIKGGQVPKDAWDNDFIYSSDARTYEIRSLGSDAAEGGEGNAADLSSKTASTRE